ncbi:MULTISPECIES: hypothetical protein [Chitinophagaceae]
MEAIKGKMQISLLCICDFSDMNLLIRIKNTGKGHLKFIFSNNTGGLARNAIKITDSRQIRLFPFDKIFISPKDNTAVKTCLQENECEIFELSGKFIKEDERLLLSFKGVSYKLEAGEKYYLHFEYKSSVSNTIEFYA